MFIHSISVPRIYKEAARIAKKVKEDGASVKVLLYQKKHPNVKGIYALVIDTLQQFSQLEFLIKKSKLFENEPRFDPWLARILITELLWGKKKLSGESKPVKTVLAYEQILKAHMTDIHSRERSVKVQNPRYVRVNTLKLSLNEAVEGFRDEGWTFFRYMDGSDYAGFLERVANMGEEEFLVDVHVDNLLIFPPKTQFYKHPAYLDGQIILQDKASCLPVQILNPAEGSVALDMCAAPGMKTTQLAAHMNNTGSIYAVEKDQKRLETLNKMLETAGVTCVTVLNKDVVTVTAKDIPGVEYILVDPTCSGSGIVNRIEVENNFEPVEQRVAKLAGFQIKILKHALRSFPDAKRIVYSTCSMYPQENEDVVAEVISSSTKFKLVPIQNSLKAPWLNVASNEEGSVGNHCIYARPEDDLTNGFFVAAFERLVDGERNVFLKERYNRNEQFEDNINTDNWEENEGEQNDEQIVMDKKRYKGKNETIDGENKQEFNEDEYNKESSKKKKKKRTHDDNENVQSDDVKMKKQNEVVCGDDDVKKSKIKKKKHIGQEENANEGNKTNENSESSDNNKGKTKKIKKSKNSDESTEIIDEISEVNDVEDKTNKRKKKKKNNDVDAGNKEISDDVDDNTNKELKKKRENNEDLITNDMEGEISQRKKTQESVETVDDVGNKKKKKKKRFSDVNDELINSVDDDINKEEMAMNEINDIGDKTNKRKKKKKNNTEDNTVKIEKKKEYQETHIEDKTHKTKKAEVDDEIMEDNTDKRKKRKKSKDESEDAINAVEDKCNKRKKKKEINDIDDSVENNKKESNNTVDDADCNTSERKKKKRIKEENSIIDVNEMKESFIGDFINEDKINNSIQLLERSGKKKKKTKTAVSDGGDDPAAPSEEIINDSEDLLVTKKGKKKRKSLID